MPVTTIPAEKSSDPAPDAGPATHGVVTGAATAAGAATMPTVSRASTARLRREARDDTHRDTEGQRAPEDRAEKILLEPVLRRENEDEEPVGDARRQDPASDDGEEEPLQLVARHVTRPATPGGPGAG